MHIFKEGDYMVCGYDSTDKAFTAGSIYICQEVSEDKTGLKAYDNNNDYNGWSAGLFRPLTEEEERVVNFGALHVGKEVIERGSGLRGKIIKLNTEVFPVEVTLNRVGVHPPLDFETQGFKLMPSQVKVVNPPNLEEVGLDNAMINDAVTPVEMPEGLVPDPIPTFLKYPEHLLGANIEDVELIREGEIIYLPEGIHEIDDSLKAGYHKVTTGGSFSVVGLENGTYVNDQVLLDYGVLVEAVYQPKQQDLRAPLLVEDKELYIEVREGVSYVYAKED